LIRRKRQNLEPIVNLSDITTLEHFEQIQRWSEYFKQCLLVIRKFSTEDKYWNSSLDTENTYSFHNINERFYLQMYSLKIYHWYKKKQYWKWSTLNSRGMKRIVKNIILSTLQTIEKRWNALKKLNIFNRFVKNIKIWHFVNFESHENVDEGIFLYFYT